jgi:O-antigen/teichoic acid export membrane protein
MIACMAIMIGCGSFLMIASEGFRITKNDFLANLTMAETSSFVIASLHLGFLALIYLTTKNTLELSLMSLTLAMAIPAIVGLTCLHRAIARRQPAASEDQTNEENISYAIMLKAGGLAMIIQSITNLTLICDQWFVEWYCSSDDLGYFAAAKRMINLSAVPMSVISASAAASIATYYSQGRSKELQAMLRKLVWYGACPSLVFLIACLLLPTQILDLYYGKGYGEGSSILSIMTLGYFLLAVVGAAEMSLVMTGQLKTALLISMVAFLSLVVGLVFASGFGVLAIAWTSAIVLGLRSIAMCVAFGLTSGVWTNLHWPLRRSAEG